MEPKVIGESGRFTIEIGTVGDDKDPQYLVRSKEHGVVEFSNPALYFVRDWAKQMTKALEEQETEELVEKNKNVVSLFNGGGSTN